MMADKFKYDKADHFVVKKYTVWRIVAVSRIVYEACWISMKVFEANEMQAERDRERTKAIEKKNDRSDNSKGQISVSQFLGRFGKVNFCSNKTRLPLRKSGTCRIVAIPRTVFKKSDFTNRSLHTVAIFNKSKLCNNNATIFYNCILKVSNLHKQIYDLTTQLCYSERYADSSNDHKDCPRAYLDILHNSSKIPYSLSFESQKKDKNLNDILGSQRLGMHLEPGPIAKANKHINFYGTDLLGITSWSQRVTFPIVIGKKDNEDNIKKAEKKAISESACSPVGRVAEKRATRNFHGVFPCGGGGLRVHRPDHSVPDNATPTRGPRPLANHVTQINQSLIFVAFALHLKKPNFLGLRPKNFVGRDMTESCSVQAPSILSLRSIMNVSNNSTTWLAKQKLGYKSRTTYQDDDVKSVENEVVGGISAATRINLLNA
ncbi:hypothetical protein WN51_13423 [Melipona quadrifasciata]|uniref:Uncharacterized protein n=1 Tax=Melipona quadrifasciata TaxID=166423 RepID=A0A0M9A2I6_9HYME|nr:hypothetical protein WN51_13423 [Melipona quadrifasciata]